MGYMKIQNLYKDIRILDFKECYALEKIHGTSSHIKYTNQDGTDSLLYHGGGVDGDTFMALFNQEELMEKFKGLGCLDTTITVYGESYGGKMQKMSETYGKELRFIAFEVQIGDTWLNVENAHDVANKLGFEFVGYERGPAVVDWLNEQRDMPSELAMRRGIGVTVKDGITFIEEEKMREGIVIRPLMEYRDYRGNRIITKHKRDEFKETKTKREVDPDKLKVLADAQEVAEEWVTDMRMQHVLDKLPEKGELKHIPMVIKAMIEDVKAESEGEVEWSKAVEKSIGRTAVKVYKKAIGRI